MKALLTGSVCVCALLLAESSVRATPVTVDQIIFQNGSGVDSSMISGTVDITSAGNTLTIILKNTSPDAAFTDPIAPALMMLTGVGLQLPGVDIVSGTVMVNAGSTPVNFDVGQNTMNIGNQWNYANLSTAGWNIAGNLPVDTTMSSVQNGQSTRFAGAPPVNIDGPDYGAISANETQFGLTQPGVNDTIKIVLTLSGAAPSEADIDAGNIVLAFGSPESGPGLVPDGGSTLALLGGALTIMGWFGRRKAAAKS